MLSGTKRIFLERAASTKLVAPDYVIRGYAYRCIPRHIPNTFDDPTRKESDALSRKLFTNRCPRLLTRWSISGIGGRVTFLHPRMEYRDETHRCERETTKLDKKLLQDWFLLNSCKVFVTMLIRIYYSTLVDWYNDMYPRTLTCTHTCSNNTQGGLYIVTRTRTHTRTYTYTHTYTKHTDTYTDSLGIARFPCWPRF